MKHHLSFYCFKPWSLISKLSTNRYSYSAFNVPNVNNKHLFEVVFPGLFCVPWYHSLICTCLLLSMFPCLVLYVKLTLVSRSVASSCFFPPSNCGFLWLLLCLLPLSHHVSSYSCVFHLVRLLLLSWVYMFFYCLHSIIWKRSSLERIHTG